MFSSPNSGRRALEVSDTLQLLETEAQLLEGLQYPTSQMKRLPDLHVEIKGAVIHFKGPPGVIGKARAELLTFKENMYTTKYKGPTDLLQFACSGPVTRHINDNLKEIGISVAWKIIGDSIVISAANADDGSCGKEIIASSIKQNSVPLTPEYNHLLQTPQWADFKKRVESNHGGLVKLQARAHRDPSLVISGAATVLDTVTGQTKTFLCQHAIVRESVSVTKDAAHYIIKCLNQTLSTSHGSGKVDYSAGACNSVVHFSGNGEDVQEAVKKTNNFVKQLRVKTYPLDQFGRQKLFKSQKGAYFCDSLQQRLQDTAVQIILDCDVVNTGRFSIHLIN